MQQEIFEWTDPRRQQNLCREVLAGGPRGPGKSAAGRIWVADPLVTYNANYRGIILRKTYAEMEEMIEECWKLYQRMGATRAGQQTTFTFPTGATVYTGYLKDERAFEQYRGFEYHRIFVDEAQQAIPKEELYLMLMSTNRSTVPGIIPQILLTANPDGPGRVWLRDRFVRRIIDVNCKFDGKNFGVGKEYKGGDWAPAKMPLLDPANGRIRIYLPGVLAENPSMMLNNPNYALELNDEKHPEHRRRAWVIGDWDAAGGAFFPSFRPRKIAKEAPEAIHVIPAFDLPHWCHRWMSFDWGHNHHSAVYWYAIGPDRRIHVTKEFVMAGADSTELGAEIAKESLPYLQRMTVPRLRCYSGADIFHTRDRNHMIANQVAQGVQTVLGAKSAAITEFTSEERQVSLTNLDMALGMQRQRLAEMDIDNASIWFTQGNSNRKAGWAFMQTLFRWWPIKRSQAATPEQLAHANFLLNTKGQLAYQSYMAMFDKSNQEILPMVVIHDCCDVLIANIPEAFSDPSNPDDVLKWDSTPSKIGDDPLDSFRMGVMGYQSHEYKVPMSVWLQAEVMRLAKEGGVENDFTSKMQIAMQAKARYEKENDEGDMVTVPREAMLLRRGNPFEL